MFNLAEEKPDVKYRVFDDVDIHMIRNYKAFFSQNQFNMTDKYKGKVTLYGKPCIYIHNLNFSQQSHTFPSGFVLDYDWLASNSIEVKVERAFFNISPNPQGGSELMVLFVVYIWVSTLT